MSEISKVIASEIADFFAGFGGPGEPDIQSGEAQRLLTERLLSVLALRERAEPVAGADMCDREVFEKGTSACLVALPKETAEIICRGISAAAGCRIDWHYVGGRVHIKALRAAPPAPVVVQPVSAPYKLPEGWIACSERMPDDGVSVLAYCKCGDNFSGIYTMRAPVIRSKNSRKDDSLAHHERVTHWMPLPAAPGKEG
ncbi:DUF551 domain-containing protein [Cronobacter turicensis]